MSKMVKAAVLEAPHKMSIQEFPYPKLEKGAAVVKMIMSGVCGTDKHSYKGENKQYGGTSKEQSTPFPIILGHENVGIIADIDTEASKNLEFNGEVLKEGDRVTWSPDVICGKCYDCRHTTYSWCDNMQMLYGNSRSSVEPPHLFGGFAEYIYIIPGTHVFKVPDSLSDECACMAEIFDVACNVDKAKEFYSFAGEGFGCNDTVIVQGVGPIGITHMIRARILGAGKVVAIDTSDFRLNMAKEFGADYTLNAGLTTPEERLRFILDITKGKGADLIFECVGRPVVVPEAMNMVRKGGMIVEAGHFVDTGSIPINIHQICAKSIRFIGQSSLHYGAYSQLMDMMLNYKKWIPFEKLITHRYKLEDAETAILKAMDEDSMKVVVCGNM